MISSCSSVRSDAVPGPFDFGSNDVLCSYDDHALQLDRASSGKQFYPVDKDVHVRRVRSPSSNLCGQSEVFLQEDVISALEECLEKCTDNLMVHLEGISGRLTQLELYCYKLERSVGEIRTDMIHHQSEDDLKLKSLTKHVREVHRSVQIIRDRQELSETQNELAKHCLSQNVTNSTQHQKNSEGLDAPSSSTKPYTDNTNISNHQAPLSLPLQACSSPPPLAPVPEQNHPYKKPPLQHYTPASPSLLPQTHYVLNQANTCVYIPQPEPHYAPQGAPMAATPQPLISQSHLPCPQFPPLYPSYSLTQHAYTTPGSYQGSSLPPAQTSAIPQNILPLASPSPFAPLPLADTAYVGTSMLGNPVYFIGGGNTSRPQNHQQMNYSPNGSVAAPANSTECHFGDMVEKAVGMGYPRDQVVCALHRIQIAEGGQPLHPNHLTVIPPHFLSDKPLHNHY